MVFFGFSVYFSGIYLQFAVEIALSFVHKDNKSPPGMYK